MTEQKLLLGARYSLLGLENILHPAPRTPRTIYSFNL